MKYILLLIAIFITAIVVTNIYTDSKTPKELRYSKFCESRGGVLYDEYRQKINTYYCKNGEHTHVPD